jgi:hypothetical protein
MIRATAFRCREPSQETDILEQIVDTEPLEPHAQEFRYRRLVGSDNQMHVRFAGYAAPFPAVAGSTRGNAVFKAVVAAARSRDNVIDRQSLAFLTAIGTFESVSNHNVFLVERHTRSVYGPDQFDQPHDRRNFEFDTAGAFDDAIRVFEDLDLPLGQQTDCPFPIDQIQKSVVGIQQDTVAHLEPPREPIGLQ